MVWRWGLDRFHTFSTFSDFEASCSVQASRLGGAPLLPHPLLLFWQGVGGDRFFSFSLQPLGLPLLCVFLLIMPFVRSRAYFDRRIRLIRWVASATTIPSITHLRAFSTSPGFHSARTIYKPCSETTMVLLRASTQNMSISYITISPFREASAPPFHRHSSVLAAG